MIHRLINSAVAYRRRGGSGAVPFTPSNDRLAEDGTARLNEDGTIRQKEN